MNNPANILPLKSQLATQSEPVQLIRHAMAKHIKEVAQELLYWMEELNKIETELGAASQSAKTPARANG
jgi:hypothetical protein